MRIISLRIAAAGALTALALLPAAAPSHAAETGKVVRVADAKALAALFDRQGYTLDAVASSGHVPPLFVDRVPDDLAKLPAAAHTSLFLRLVLPSYLRANADVRQAHNRLRELDAAHQSTGDLSQTESAWVDTLAQRYHAGARPLNVRALMKRVDTVPVSMGLAQAADESGWGTSGFARTANALFGEHGGAPGTGNFTTTPGGHVKVARFADIKAACAGYIFTINTTRAYARLRTLRLDARRAGKTPSGSVLVGQLDSYSARGEAYVKELRAIIKAHGLERLDRVRLDPHAPPLHITVSGDES